VKSLATDRSVPASVALADSDYDGYVDRAYAVDIGGNVYRIDFETAAGASAVSGWAITKLAALQDAGNTRKFFYDPDIVQTNVFTALMLGSGNREQPLFCRTPTSIELAGGGLPPSPVTGTVEVQVPPIAGDPNQTTTKKVPFIIGGINPALSSLAVSKVPINVDPTRRIYWYSSNVH